ncbi:MAG TPA: hypothetical protein VN048_19275 [Verrucomicrobiae bacterium]|jgi:hypothetical protein|nr:hypothetical protein [Verrucomicrobiae bacterium]
MKRALKVCLTAIALLLAGVSLWSWAEWEYGPPSEQRLRKQFEMHRADYIRFATLLRNDRSTKGVGADGMAEIDGIHTRLVPEYRDLVRRIGAKDVTIREDGSVDFELWGHGCAICSDYYRGVLYIPKGHMTDGGGHRLHVVDSFDSDKLPQERGLVASGLYVIAIEPEWFIYRYEYQE